MKPINFDDELNTCETTIEYAHEEPYDHDYL